MKARRRFAWDEEKRRQNIRRHGLDFRNAKRIFDGHRLEEFDDSHSEGEDRYWTLGLMDQRVIKVVYTLREGTIRLISAFAASEDEAERYFSIFFGDPVTGDEGHGKRKNRHGKGSAPAGAKLDRRRGPRSG